MVDAGMNTYDGKISGNVLVLSSTGSEKNSLAQRMGYNGMFGQLEKIHRISKVDLSEERKVEIDSCFKAEVKFYNLQEEYKLDKTFIDLENTYREKQEKRKQTVDYNEDDETDESDTKWYK